MEHPRNLGALPTASPQMTPTGLRAVRGPGGLTWVYVNGTGWTAPEDVPDGMVMVSATRPVLDITRRQLAVAWALLVVMLMVVGLAVAVDLPALAAVAGAGVGVGIAAVIWSRSTVPSTAVDGQR